MLTFSGIAAALLLAVAMNASPSGDSSRYQMIEALKGREARPLAQLPAPVRQTVEEALAQQDCVTATKHLIDIYLQDYPKLKPLRHARDFAYIWWLIPGHDVYPDGFVCFMQLRLREQAAYYISQYGSAGGEYRWCGDQHSPRPDPTDRPVVYDLDVALDWLGLMADGGHIEAIRALLAAHGDYDFVELEDVTRYALVAHLAEQTTLTANEHDLKNTLAKRLPREVREDAERGSGYSAIMREYGSCGEERFDAMRDLGKRPALALNELNAAVREAVDAALAQNDCAVVTELLIHGYLNRYPDMRPLLRERDYETVWWMFAGEEVYPDLYVCFLLERLRQHAGEYAEAGPDDFSWCGDLRSRRPNAVTRPVANALHWMLDLLATAADNEHLPAMRALLAANRQYDFVQLDDVAQYAILAHISQQDALTAEEAAETEALAARLPEEARDQAEWSFGYMIAMREFGTCGNRAE